MTARAAIGVSIILASASPLHADSGPATIMGQPGDTHHSGGPMACVLRGETARRVIRPTDMVIALRGARCGQRVRVCRGKRCVTAVVADRGPWGACLDPGWTRGPCTAWRVKRHASDPGTWRGIADLGYAVAQAIGHRSHGWVRIERIGRAVTP